MTDFAQVEKEFERLKAEFESGALTEAEFKGQLEELMIEDEQGQWWIIGYESGLWYYHDGDQWVQSDSPPVVQRLEQAEVEAEVEVVPAPVPVEEPEPEVEVVPAPVPAAEAEVEAAPMPERPEEPEVAPVAEEKPVIRPAVPEAAEAVSTQPKSRTVWIVAAVIMVIVVVIVLIRLFPGPSPEPEFGIWAERDAIPPGECTLLLWAAPDLEGVFVVGPDTDDTMLMPPEGNLEVCPEGTSWYELKSPEWEELSRVQVHVGE